MGLLKFTLMAIDNVAWPAIALGYPLIPYWSIRLVVIYWLVMPELEGACLAYEGLVTPASLVKLQLVIDLYYKLKEERLCERVFFSDAVEKYIKENGFEALEKLIELEKHHKIDFQRKTNTVHCRNLKPVFPKGLLKFAFTHNSHMLLDLHLQVRHEQSISLPCAKGMTPIPEASMENRCPQQEWRCDLCKVNARSEKSLINHLLGRKHKSKFNQSLKVNEIKIRDGEQWCIVCDVKLPSTVDAASSHFKGKLTLVKY